MLTHPLVWLKDSFRDACDRPILLAPNYSPKYGMGIPIYYKN